MMLPFTELMIDDATYNLNGSALTSGDVSRKFSKERWTLRDVQALFFAAWKSGGNPGATRRGVTEIVTSETAAACRAGLIEAAESAMDEMLRGQRYVM